MKEICRSLLLGFCGLVLLGCNENRIENKANKNLEAIIKQPIAQTSQRAHSKNIQNPSYKKGIYKLYRLCDTGIYWKNMKLHVYIEDSKVLWDYHKYKNDIFGYVKDFFKENKINCEISYSEKQFSGFSSNHEFGLEIVSSSKNMKNRRDDLLKELGITPKYDPYILYGKGYGVTKAGVALISAWEEFRVDLETGEMTPKDIEEQFLREYRGVSVKEYLFKQNASLICHEILHCLGLAHPHQVEPPIITDLDFIPNIMGNRLPELQKEFQDKHSIGYKFDRIQEKFIHSFLAGKGSYKAFVHSNRNLDVYLENLAKANNRELYGE